MDETVKKQILEIRDTGLTNMLDIQHVGRPGVSDFEDLDQLVVVLVQRLAFDRNYYELVLFLEDHRKEYAHFILTGKE